MSDNLYRQRIRGKYNNNKNFYFIIRLLIIVILIFLVVHFGKKYDVIGKIQSKFRRNIEQITKVDFNEIDFINTDVEDNINVQEFIDKYKDTKYKLNTDANKLSENGDVTYHVYKKGGKLAYELYDLGDGYIKIIKNGDIPATYKAVK